MTTQFNADEPIPHALYAAWAHCRANNSFEKQISISKGHGCVVCHITRPTYYFDKLSYYLPQNNWYVALIAARWSKLRTASEIKLHQLLWSSLVKIATILFIYQMQANKILGIHNIYLSFPLRLRMLVYDYY